MPNLISEKIPTRTTFAQSAFMHRLHITACFSQPLLIAKTSSQSQIVFAPPFHRVVMLLTFCWWLESSAAEILVLPSFYGGDRALFSIETRTETSIPFVALTPPKSTISIITSGFYAFRWLTLTTFSWFACDAVCNCHTLEGVSSFVHISSLYGHTASY